MEEQSFTGLGWRNKVLLVWDGRTKFYWSGMEEQRFTGLGWKTGAHREQGRAMLVFSETQFLWPDFTLNKFT
jgi:hypothetical protein